MHLTASSLPPDALDRATAVVGAVGQPCALSGATLAALRQWDGVDAPTRPRLVVPASRRAVGPSYVVIRRVAKWEELELLDGPAGLPALGLVDGLFTLAPESDDGTVHTLLQRFAYDGELDVSALMRRRRTGLPGSARITRVGTRYLLGMDSPREAEVYGVLRSRGLAPDHLNVSVTTADGRTVGPYDGYADVGAAYEVDSVHHIARLQLDRDLRKDAAAKSAGVELVRFIGDEISARLPMLEGWLRARDAAVARGPGVTLTVVHQDGRACICGYPLDPAIQLVDGRSKIKAAVRAAVAGVDERSKIAAGGVGQVG